MSIEVKTRSGLDGRRPPVTMNELPALTRKGRAWNYRAMAAGLIRYIWIGDQRYIPPEEADRIEREGIASLRSADARPPKRRARFPRREELQPPSTKAPERKNARRGLASAPGSARESAFVLADDAGGF